MSEELKPCPICGRRPDLENITRDDRLGNIDCCIIECRMPRPSKDRPRGSCWVKHCVMVVEDTEEQAIAAWNHREEPNGKLDVVSSKPIQKSCIHEKDCANYGVYSHCTREFTQPICCCHFKAIPDEVPEWLKNIISGNIELLKTIPDLDGQTHGNIQALEWVLGLRRDK